MVLARTEGEISSRDKFVHHRTMPLVQRWYCTPSLQRSLNEKEVPQYGQDCCYSIDLEEMPPIDFDHSRPHHRSKDSWAGSKSGTASSSSPPSQQSHRTCKAPLGVFIIDSLTDSVISSSFAAFKSTSALLPPRARISLRYGPQYFFLFWFLESKCGKVWRICLRI